MKHSKVKKKYAEFFSFFYWKIEIYLVYTYSHGVSIYKKCGNFKHFSVIFYFVFFTTWCYSYVMSIVIHHSFILDSKSWLMMYYSFTFFHSWKKKTQPILNFSLSRISVYTYYIVRNFFLKKNAKNKYFFLFTGGVRPTMYSSLPRPLMSKSGFQGCIASFETNGELEDPIKHALVPSPMVEEGCEGNH